EHALQDFRFVPRHDVGRSGGRERHDDGHRPARIIVSGDGVPRRNANQRAQDSCERDGPRPAHAFLPVLFTFHEAVEPGTAAGRSPVRPGTGFAHAVDSWAPSSNYGTATRGGKVRPRSTFVVSKIAR